MILSITPLDDLMLPGQYLLLQNLCPSAFVNARYLEDLSRVHIGVSAPAHDSDTADHAFVNLCASGVSRLYAPCLGAGQTWTEE